MVTKGEGSIRNVAERFSTKTPEMGLFLISFFTDGRNKELFKLRGKLINRLHYKAMDLFESNPRQSGLLEMKAETYQKKLKFDRTCNRLAKAYQGKGMVSEYSSKVGAEMPKKLPRVLSYEDEQFEAGMRVASDRLKKRLGK